MDLGNILNESLSIDYEKLDLFLEKYDLLQHSFTNFVTFFAHNRRKKDTGKIARVLKGPFPR